MQHAPASFVFALLVTHLSKSVVSGVGFQQVIRHVQLTLSSKASDGTDPSVVPLQNGLIRSRFFMTVSL